MGLAMADALRLCLEGGITFRLLQKVAVSLHSLSELLGWPLLQDHISWKGDREPAVATVV